MSQCCRVHEAATLSPKMSTFHQSVTTQAPRYSRSLSLQDAAESSTSVAYASAELDPSALAAKTARGEQGMGKQSRTTGLPDFMAETTFGKGGAETVYAVSHLSSCNVAALSIGVRDDHEVVKNVIHSRMRAVERTLSCVREHRLAHLTEHSKA